MESYAVDLDAIRSAQQQIAAYVHQTPVLTSRAVNDIAGCSLYFKCENLQKGGAFKMRGAMNAVLSLSNDAAQRGVVTHSSGNFAQAVALAANARGIPAHIVMPENAPAVKRRAVAGYGGRIVLCAANLAAREETAAKVQDETGATFLHPYDQPEVIAGQGTVALELVQQLESFDAVVVPIGGGGLISGITLALRELRPEVPVFGAEPVGADDAYRSKLAGERIPQTSPDTIADGLLTSLGEYTWPVIRDLVHEIVCVTDEEIIAAMRIIWERMKIIVEPSSATVLAAVLNRSLADRMDGKNVALVISGGNVDLGRLPF
ncbi:MAG: serine dehydratase [Myxococcales bacterium]|nr:serine dehydratase [Myxococcales bacterium]|tara:strand:- start:1125 stop:2081 length:957 start_codon:yes stop_codon:yes gene_type:complete